MQKNPLLFCGFTIMMGIFGAFLRWIQNMLSFEADTLLAIENSPWHYLVLIYLMGFAIFLWLFVRRYKNHSMPMKYPATFRCDNKLWYIGTIVFTVIMALGSLATIFRSITTENGNVFLLVLGLFSAICAICFKSFISGTRGRNVKNGGFAGLIIVLFFCYRLIENYKAYAPDPVIWHFAIQLLAISTSLLAFYYVCGFAYNSPKMLLALYFCHLGAFLSIISCADNVSIGINLISISTAGFLILLSYAQLSNMHYPEAIREEEIKEFQS